MFWADFIPINTSLVFEQNRPEMVYFTVSFYGLLIGYVNFIRFEVMNCEFWLFLLCLLAFPINNFRLCLVLGCLGTF